MNNKVLIGAVVGILVLISLGFSILKNPAPSQPGLVGAVSSPDIMSPYISFGGVMLNGAAQNMRTGSTTICALQAPASTSTLRWASVDFSVSSTSASIVTIGRATTAFATTTLLGRADLAANAKDTIIASTSPSAGEATIFGPNEWLVVGMAGGSGTFSPIGTCAAEWSSVKPR